MTQANFWRSSKKSERSQSPQGERKEKRNDAHLLIIYLSLGVSATAFSTLLCTAPLVYENVLYYESLAAKEFRHCTSVVKDTSIMHERRIKLSSEVNYADPSLSNSTSLFGRSKRQSYACQRCCLPGHPGQNGFPGKPGRPGVPGTPGRPGRPGRPPIICVEPVIPPCRSCPPGPPGRQGPDGAPGNPGRPGNAGRPGNPGNPGSPGPQGPPGQPGQPGQPGRPGEAGRPALSTPNTPGDPGRPGQPGSPGLPGDPGRPGENGRVGNQGSPGLPGRPGVPGTPGTPGPKGPRGLPGRDGNKGVCEDCTYTTTPPPRVTAGYLDVRVGKCSRNVPERFVDYNIAPFDSIPLPPQCLINIAYNAPEQPNQRLDIYLGTSCYQNTTAPKPIEVYWPTRVESLYTLVVYDLDEESRQNPNQRELLLWLIINIPGRDASDWDVRTSSMEQNGRTLVEYQGPRPRVGTGRHRVVWLAYEQQERMPDSVYQFGARSGFKVHSGFVVPNQRYFVQTVPVAGNFLMAEYNSQFSNFSKA